jgi:hypothetical protein
MRRLRVKIYAEFGLVFLHNHDAFALPAIGAVFLLERREVTGFEPTIAAMN